MKTLIWDVDDVLNDLMQEWFEDYKSINTNCKLNYDDLIENPPNRLLSIGLNEYRDLLDKFRFENGLNFKPNKEILEWFQAYGHNYRHIALTAVPLHLSYISADWVLKNFGNWIRSFNIVPSPRETDPSFKYDSSKKEYIQWLKHGDFLIDDNPLNIKGAEELNIHAITIPRPWNNSKQTITESLQYLTNYI